MAKPLELHYPIIQLFLRAYTVWHVSTPCLACSSEERSLRKITIRIICFQLNLLWLFLTVISVLFKRYQCFSRKGLLDITQKLALLYQKLRPILLFITHRLIFEQFYWLFWVTWYKIGGRISRNTPRPKRYLSSDFGSQLRNGNIQCSVFSLFNFHGKQTNSFWRSNKGTCCKCCSGKHKKINKIRS